MNLTQAKALLDSYKNNKLTHRLGFYSDNQLRQYGVEENIIQARQVVTNSKMENLRGQNVSDWPSEWDLRGSKNGQ